MTNPHSIKRILNKLTIPFMVIVVFLFSHSCATFKEHQRIPASSVDDNKEIMHTFYLAGGYGNVSEASNKKLLEKFKSEIGTSGENSTVIFTGDNVSATSNAWEKDSLLISEQIGLVEDFKGNTIFLPGNSEWKSYELDKMEKVEDYLKEIDLEGIEVFPENGCPIEYKVINDDLDLILIDSKWFISNWSRLVDINKKCDNIVTRRRFMEELEGYINDGQGKNIVIAMHHPVMSNGIYAGTESFKSHMTPLPVLGTLRNAVMDLGAFDPDHLNSRRYNYLRIAVSALAQANDRITLVSGHEENLQLLSGGGIHQIISGSLGSKSPTKIEKNQITAIGGSMAYEGDYAYGERGFARLDFYDDGSSQVTFISEDDLDNSKTFDLLKPMEEEKQFTDIDKNIGKTVTTPILDNPEDYEKSGFYKFLWGERYRSYFGKPVNAPVVNLDTLYGGLHVVKEGGGHQSFSLRLADKDGKQYAMRSLRKSALKFLKFKLPGISYSSDDYRDTWAEEVISDFFTTAHPYMQLVVNPLAESVGINHSDTELFYVPRQPQLEQYNENFGDELYFIQRRPSDEQFNYKGYRRTIDKVSGTVKDFESTTDMLERIKRDESFAIDQKNFIRARIFDMLIGDWDRHQDQWRWIEYETPDGEKEFMPVPRDRDNVFPRFDGNAMKLVKLFVPTTKRWQTFDGDIDNAKWQNMGGNKLDRALLTKYGTEVWVEEAKYIQEHMTPEVIENAFMRLPVEVRDETAEFLKSSLEERLKTLPEKAGEYGEYLNKVVAITGTEKDDLFEVQKLPNGELSVRVKRLLTDEKNEIFFQRIFKESETEQVWLYGLGDDDIFQVAGTENPGIKLKIIGGYGEDIYDIENKKRVLIYDWEHEEIHFKDKEPKTQLSDIYTTNNYHWRYFKPNTNILVPTTGFRTDDGFFLGASNTYTKNGLNGNDFRQRHTLKANYYFNFAATEVQYSGAFGNIFPKWNFILDGYYTSDRYARNYFGTGNETVNNENALGRDYYRARLKQLKASAGISYYTLKIRGLFESFKLNESDQRLFNQSNLRPELFENQNYGGAEISGYYDNDDADDFPSKSIYIGLRLGYKANLNLQENNFAYASLKLGFNHKLISSGALVLGSTAAYNTVSKSNDIFFYHTPSIGGDNGLRGFRDERFTGRSSFYQSTDLKWRIKRYVTAVSPVIIGMYGGFDYGRVWSSNESSNVWHTSQGGGLWISSLKALTFNIGYFNSKEGNMVQVGFLAPF
ncbi:ShlB/FhaC/HecB family hemolysin secretion/activation protein [Maribacter sp. PR1]|uniref:ShlB/FhaC/HecB family hemolysin secretion/activation protein n=1 Tax=Maribacter cobaltidurans TaxID=1178778 RepID=A0ABU7IU91_9FLAO|nr:MULTISPECIES: ShlB/FhaC/HecB family hemolysin secretion/activation protein [Maribacter]MDC6389020.1 ShlB/FhaC/HecB family hemolysin secretion/activation protein [Maribacter sp. PR1]MEE1976408.1 ShlB/FhaC/HecB family hemolysin secretion/activation protein [Maribacter cobaltidurans]